MDREAGQPQVRQGLEACGARQAEVVQSRGGLGGAVGRTAAGSGEPGGAAADFGAEGRIEEKTLERRGEIGRGCERNHRSVFLEFRCHFGEIFHMGPGEDWSAEGGRLEDVVAAAAGKRPPHEDGRGEAEQGGELADGVEQEDAGQRQRLRRGQAGAAEKRDSAGGQFFRGGGEGLRAAGGENEEEAGEAGGKGEEGVEDDAVLVGAARGGGRHGGGGDPDGRGLERVEKFPNIGGDLHGIRIEVVLEISGNFDSGRPEGAVTGGGGAVLGEDEVGQGKDAAEEPAEAEVAGKSPVRNAGVDDEEAGAVAAGFAKEVGPDFGFGDDEKRGPEAAQHAAHGEAVVDGGEKDTVGEAGEFFFADGAARESGSGDIEGHGRQAVPEPAEKRHGGEDLADADGMQPDGAGGRREEMAGQEAESFAQPAEVAAVSQDAETQIE